MLLAILTLRFLSALEASDAARASTFFSHSFALSLSGIRVLPKITRVELIPFSC